MLGNFALIVFGMKYGVEAADEAQTLLIHSHKNNTVNKNVITEKGGTQKNGRKQN